MLPSRSSLEAMLTGSPLTLTSKTTSSVEELLELDWLDSDTEEEGSEWLELSWEEDEGLLSSDEEGLLSSEEEDLLSSVEEGLLSADALTLSEEGCVCEVDGVEALLGAEVSPSPPQEASNKETDKAKIPNKDFFILECFPFYLKVILAKSVLRTRLG